MVTYGRQRREERKTGRKDKTAKTGRCEENRWDVRICGCQYNADTNVSLLHWFHIVGGGGDEERIKTDKNVSGGNRNTDVITDQQYVPLSMFIFMHSNTHTQKKKNVSKKKTNIS